MRGYRTSRRRWPRNAVTAKLPLISRFKQFGQKPLNVRPLSVQVAHPQGRVGVTAVVLTPTLQPNGFRCAFLDELRSDSFDAETPERMR
jgi:hypothetical protein